jgi:Flp pilus assembly protein TadD
MSEIGLKRKGTGLGRALPILLFSGLILFFAPAPLRADNPGEGAIEAERVGLGLADDGKLDEAIAKMKEAVGWDSGYASAHTNLGYLLLKKNDVDGAQKEFDEALKLNPTSHNAKTGKGIVLSIKGDLKGAQEILQDALTLNPDPGRTYYELGMVYEKQGDMEKAIAEYKKGVEKLTQGRK